MVWSSVATTDQLGFDFHAGFAMDEPKTEAATGNCESAMNSAFSSSRSAQKPE